MKAFELAEKYDMKKHAEGGRFCECHYEHTETERAASGKIYYYVSPGERTTFHRIDCDEYWCYNAGETLEIWVIDNAGMLHIKRLGTSKGAEPAIRIAEGEIFASRLTDNAPDGCFLTCITVPRFEYEGFELFEKERITEIYPQTVDFWK